MRTAPSAEPHKPASAADAPRFDTVATAAAIAVLLTALSIGVHPWVPSPSWSDALVNQALILFAAGYVILAVATAIYERFTRRTRHPLSR
jgi:hypothetical protein